MMYVSTKSAYCLFISILVVVLFATFQSGVDYGKSSQQHIIEIAKSYAGLLEKQNHNLRKQIRDGKKTDDKICKKASTQETQRKKERMGQ